MRKKHTIEIIAPSSSTPDLQVPKQAVEYLESLGFAVNFPSDLLSSALVYEANTKEYRLNHFLKAANDDSIDTILMLRGGYSAAKWVTKLMECDLPKAKFFVGFSDGTALHLVLNQHFNWKCVHGLGLGQLPNKVTQESIDKTIAVFTGATTSLSIPGLVKMNNVEGELSGKLTGGNLSLLQTSIGTAWQIDCEDKIVFIEDVGEPGYKLDRMFEHLMQSGTLDGAKAIVLGDFTHGNPDMHGPIKHALSEFAKRMEEQECAVFKVDNAFGHGEYNTPLVIGADAYIADSTLYYSW